MSEPLRIGLSLVFLLACEATARRSRLHQLYRCISTSLSHLDEDIQNQIEEYEYGDNNEFWVVDVCQQKMEGSTKYYVMFVKRHEGWLVPDPFLMVITVDGATNKITDTIGPVACTDVCDQFVDKNYFPRPRTRRLTTLRPTEFRAKTRRPTKSNRIWG